MYTSRKTLITNDNCTSIPLGWFLKIYNLLQIQRRWGKSRLPHQRCGSPLWWHLSRLRKEKPMKNCKHLTSIWRAAVLSHTEGDLYEPCSLLTPGTLPIECPSDQMRLGVGANTDHTYWYWFSNRHSAVHIAVLTSLNSQTPHLKMKEWRLGEVAYLAQGHTDNERRSSGFHLPNWAPCSPALCYPAHVQRAAFHDDCRLVAMWVLLEPVINLASVLQLEENSSAFSQVWRIYQATLGNLPNNTSPVLCNCFLFLGSVP